ncbi:hypothetical protein PVAP13_2KG329567 [Panicum virgatum]|uniref:Uncharacterized protein n=1 Tax=Panicum virgatum TaxID=38727 RepID=A0A8T0W6M9_PANVG|nr:hypothetical protein PVAP13_2KG329567 [Panicum virgatum]
MILRGYYRNRHAFTTCERVEKKNRFSSIFAAGSRLPAVARQTPSPPNGFLTRNPVTDTKAVGHPYVALRYWSNAQITTAPPVAAPTHSVPRAPVQLCHHVGPADRGPRGPPVSERAHHHR